MRFFTTTLALAALLPATLTAQARYSFGAGATGGTKLATDRIFQDIDITQRIAPTFTLGASLPVSARERAGIEVSLGFGKTRIKEEGFSAYDGVSYKTLGFTVGADGPMLKKLRYRFGAGLTKYLADKEGIFRQGGPLLLTLTLGSDYPVITSGKVGLVARLRYNYQRFSTDELRSIGFSRTQDVHQLGLGLAVEYTR
ncbi:MAG TPA: hypothetical protein VG692_07765 [Gemmatimonadales bacterium]|nr:hypothetical protein [Gemmatimonadales bacterium]